MTSHVVYTDADLIRIAHNVTSGREAVSPKQVVELIDALMSCRRQVRHLNAELTQATQTDMFQKGKGT